MLSEIHHSARSGNKISSEYYTFEEIANANQSNRNYVANSMKFDEDKFNGMMG